MLSNRPNQHFSRLPSVYPQHCWRPVGAHHHSLLNRTSGHLQEGSLACLLLRRSFSGRSICGALRPVLDRRQGPGAPPPPQHRIRLDSRCSIDWQVRVLEDGSLSQGIAWGLRILPPEPLSFVICITVAGQPALPTLLSGWRRGDNGPPRPPLNSNLQHPSAQGTPARAPRCCLTHPAGNGLVTAGPSRTRC